VQKTVGAVVSAGDRVQEEIECTAVSATGTEAATAGPGQGAAARVGKEAAADTGANQYRVSPGSL